MSTWPRSPVFSLKESGSAWWWEGPAREALVPTEMLPDCQSVDNQENEVQKPISSGPMPIAASPNEETRRPGELSMARAHGRDYTRCPALAGALSLLRYSCPPDLKSSPSEMPLSVGLHS